MPVRLVRRLLPIIPLTAATIVAGCGGGGSGDGGSAAALSVPPGDNGAVAADVSDEVLTRNAATRIVDGFAVNAAAADASLGAVADRSGPLAAFDAGSGLVAEFASDEDRQRNPVAIAFTGRDEASTFDDGALTAESAEAAFDGGLGVATDDAWLRDLVNASIGDGHIGSVIRDGDRLTIDPDDAAFCDRLVVDATDRSDCLALAPDLSITVDAVRESSGIATWSFRGDAFLSVAYAPMAATYELSLNGMATLMRAAEALDGGTDDLPERVEGALRLTTRVDDATSGAEAGQVTLSVSRAISIEDASTGTRFTLAPSTLFSLSADAATGDAEFNVSIGALSLVLGSESESFDGMVERTMLALSMGGFSLDASLDGAADTLTVSRLGLGTRPVVVSVDGQDVVRYSMPDTGFVMDPQGQVRLTRSLDAEFEFILDPSSGMSLGSQWSAPSGTVLGQRGELLAVQSGGPLEIVTTAPDEQGNPIASRVTIVAGSCVGEDDSGEPTAVPCN